MWLRDFRKKEINSITYKKLGALFLELSITGQLFFAKVLMKAFPRGSKQAGATAVEYSLLVALVAFTAIGVMRAVGEKTSETMDVARAFIIDGGSASLPADGRDGTDGNSCEGVCPTDQ